MPLNIANTYGAKNIESGMGKYRSISQQRLKKKMRDSGVWTNFK